MRRAAGRAGRTTYKDEKGQAYWWLTIGLAILILVVGISTATVHYLIE